MKILQRIEYSKLRPKIQVKRGVADGSEIEQDDIAVRLL